MFSVQLLYIYDFASFVMIFILIVVTYFALGYSAWFQGCRWLRFSTSCGPYSSIFRQTTSHCHIVLVDDKLLVLCVVAIDPLQGSIYLCSWRERPLSSACSLYRLRSVLQCMISNRFQFLYPLTIFIFCNTHDPFVDKIIKCHNRF